MHGFLLATDSADFELDLLSPFAQACFLGIKSEVVRVWLFSY